MKSTVTVLAAIAAFGLAGCASDNVAWHDVNHLNSANPPAGIPTPGDSRAVGAEPTKPFYPAQNGDYGTGQSSQVFLGDGNGPVSPSRTNLQTPPPTPAYTTDRQ